MKVRTEHAILFAWFLLVVGVVLFVLYVNAEANEQKLYPKSYYPAPPPIHYPKTGAVCWRTDQGGWDCQAGRPADKTVNQNGGGTIWPFLNQQQRPKFKGKRPAKMKRMRVRSSR